MSSVESIEIQSMKQFKIITKIRSINSKTRWILDIDTEGYLVSKVIKTTNSKPQSEPKKVEQHIGRKWDKS